MTVCCPDCYELVAVPPSAREGRCADCRPVRRHSEPRRLDIRSGPGIDELRARYAERP
jgi:hypothetical protein